MKLKLLTSLFAVVLLLCCVLNVAAEPETGGDDSSTSSSSTTTTTTVSSDEEKDSESTTSSTESTTTTTESTTTSTESTTTSTDSTTSSTDSTTSSTSASSSSTTSGSGTTVSTQAGGTTVPTSTTTANGTTASTSTSTSASSTTTTTIPTLPPFVDTELVDRLELVTEPDADNDYLHYYRGEHQVNASDFGWVDGKEGYALILDGERHLRFVTDTFETLDAFTLTAFVNWQGGASGQKLFYISQNDYFYLKVSPYVSDTDNRIDGFYLEWQGGDMTPVKLYKPVGGDTSFRPKENEWYHLAVVVAPNELSLYVNGSPYLTCETTLNPTELQFSRFLIGGGVYGDPLLNAYLDEVYLYPEALQHEHIALLSAGIDPTVGGNLPTMDTYRPTAPTTTTTQKYVTTAPVTTPEDKEETLFGLPKAMILIPGGILLVVVVLSLLLSAKKPDETTDEGTTTLTEPEPPVDDEDEAIEPVIIPTEETSEETDGVPTDGTEEEQV